MIDIGLKRVERELEITEFLKWQMKVKIALRTLFSKAEWFLVQNNSKFVLNSDD